MKAFINTVVSFAVGAAVGAIAGFGTMAIAAVTMPEMREMTEEMSKHFDQI